MVGGTSAMMNHKIIRYFKQFVIFQSSSNTDTVIPWKPKGFSDERLKPSTMPGNLK